MTSHPGEPTQALDPLTVDLLAQFDGSVCPACHHRAHDPGGCSECPRCELHTDEALAFVLRHEPELLVPQESPREADNTDGGSRLGSTNPSGGSRLTGTQARALELRDAAPAAAPSQESPREGLRMLADTVPDGRHPKSCSRWFASDPITGEAICDCGLAAESTVEGLYQHDLGCILRSLGVGDYARSESAHMVVHDVVLPAIRALAAAPSQESPREGLREAWEAYWRGTKRVPRDFETDQCRREGYSDHLRHKVFAEGFLAAAPSPQADTGLPEELRALSEAATPGPWEEDIDFLAVMPANGFDPITRVALPEVALINPMGVPKDRQRADLGLIVAAVNYVRRALAETLRSRETPDEGLRAALEDIDEAEAGVLDAIREVLPNADQRVDVLTALHPLSEAIRKGAALARSIPETRETVE